MSKREKTQRKSSFGIALCRRDPAGPQILLVRSRITYSFSNFVFGKYKPWDTDRLTELLAVVTAAEKLLIWSCDFSRLWYHIWQKVPEACDADSFYQFYLSSRTKFERLVQRDAGKRIRALLSATPTGELGWDMPGGKAELRSDGIIETELETAQREMSEEAGVAAADYHIMHDVRPICNAFEDATSTWVRKYFLAWTDKKIEPRVSYTNQNQIGEVSAVQWCSLRDVGALVAQNKCLISQVRLAFRLFKRRSS